MLAAEWIGLTFALLPWGFAVDRFGERWTPGLGLCSAFLAAAAFAPSFGGSMLGLAGIAGGSVQSGSGRAVMRRFAADERASRSASTRRPCRSAARSPRSCCPCSRNTAPGSSSSPALCSSARSPGALVLRAGTEEHIEQVDVELTLRDRRLWLACWGSGLYPSPRWR